MKFYHGTSNSNLIDILESGYLDGMHSSEDSYIVDVIINKSICKNLRKGGLYLTLDKDYANSYDYVFEIDICELDTNLLYVACSTIKNR